MHSVSGLISAFAALQKRETTASLHLLFAVKRLRSYTACKRKSTGEVLLMQSLQRPLVIQSSSNDTVGTAD